MFLLADKLGVIDAECAFHGGGFGGGFSDPQFFFEEQVQVTENNDGEPLPEKDWFFEVRRKPFRDRVYNDETYQWEDNPKWTEEHVTLAGLIKDQAYAWVESSETDWYNNNGGRGRYNIDFRTGEVNGNIYQNETVKNSEVQKSKSAMIKLILISCKSLNMPAKHGSKDSYTVRMPSFQEFVKQLPPDKDCSAECRLFRKTKKNLEELVGGDAERPWTFYRRREEVGIDWSLDPPPKTSRRKGEDDFALNGHNTTRRNQTTAIAGSKGRKRAKG